MSKDKKQVPVAEQTATSLARIETALATKAAEFFERTRAIVKIKTQEERTAVAVLLTTNKDLQKLVHEDLDPICDGAYAHWQDTIALRKKHLDPLLAEEARCKRMQNEDNAEQERIRRERQAKLDAEAKAKAEEDRRRELAALKAAAVKKVEDALSPAIALLLRDKTLKETINEVTAGVRAWKEPDGSRPPMKLFTAMIRALRKQGDKEEAQDLADSVGASEADLREVEALAAAPVTFTAPQAVNKAQEAATAAGTTYKTMVHFEVTDPAKVGRSFLMVNETAVRRAAEALWAQASAGKADPYTWTTEELSGIRVWTTKESVDTGRRK